MRKKLFKYIKFFISLALILSLVAPSYASLSASDGSAFVTKAEFDSALADFNARLTTFEAGINSKIDSQVTSYLDRNGIWSGQDQEFIIPKANSSTSWSAMMYGGSSCMVPILGPLNKAGLLFLTLPVAYERAAEYDYWFLCALNLPGWDKDKFKRYVDWFPTATYNQICPYAEPIKKNNRSLAAGNGWAPGYYWPHNNRPDAMVYERLAGISSPMTASQIAQQAPHKKQFSLLPSVTIYREEATDFKFRQGSVLKGGYLSYDLTGDWTNLTGNGAARIIDTQMFVQKNDIVWLDNFGYWALWLSKTQPALFASNSRDYGTMAFASVY